MPAIAAQLVQELSDIRARLHEHEENGFGRQHRDDRETLLMLENDGDDFTASGGCAELVGRADDGRDTRSDVFGIQSWDDLAVDQEAVSPEHDGCVDPLALAQCGYQIANARHAGSVG